MWRPGTAHRPQPRSLSRPISGDFAGVERDGLQDKYRLILARLLTKHGNTRMPIPCIGASQRPKDAHPGGYAITATPTNLRVMVWKSLQKLKPEDEIVRGHIAEVYYLLGDFENSLHAYQHLAKRSTDLGAILKYGTLADSLGELQSLSEALAREMELKNQDTPEDFIKLAYVFNLLGADAKRQEVLVSGLGQFPDNDALRIQLSILLVEKKEGGQALLVMARSHNLKTDPDALRLYLNLLIGSGDYATAEKFLKTGVSEKIVDAPSINLLRAIVYEGNQNDAAAERIHQ
jgi:Flp pilus assembly protein TadD